MDASVELPLQPSAMQIRVVGLAHALAAGPVVLLPLAWVSRALLLGMLLASLGWVWRRRQAHAQIARLVWRRGRWSARLRDESEIALAALRVRYLGRWLVVIGIETEPGRRYRLAIFADALGADQFRRLRVLLRWAQHG